MSDVELLEGVLRCQQLLKAMSKPTDDETDAHKYLRWAAEQIAKRIWWDNREPKQLTQFDYGHDLSVLQRGW